jgi:hypothetical protein
MNSERIEVPELVFEAIDRRLVDWRKTRRYALQQGDRETEAIASACISMLLALKEEFGGETSDDDNDLAGIEHASPDAATGQHGTVNN